MKVDYLDHTEREQEAEQVALAGTTTIHLNIVSLLNRRIIQAQAPRVANMVMAWPALQIRAVRQVETRFVQTMEMALIMAEGQSNLVASMKIQGLLKKIIGQAHSKVPATAAT